MPKTKETKEAAGSRIFAPGAAAVLHASCVKAYPQRCVDYKAYPHRWVEAVARSCPRQVPHTKLVGN